MDPCERVHFEQERSRSVHAAERLRAAGLPCPEVSIGSTPTALSFENLDGITEVRAGVSVFFDLVMHNVGDCSLSEIALSVLTTVIGHQEEKGWAIVEVGWMAMSHDRGTQRLGKDFGYGQVCTVNGEVLADYLVNSAYQEHGTRCTEDAQREPHLCVSGHMTSFASSAESSSARWRYGNSRVAPRSSRIFQKAKHGLCTEPHIRTSGTLHDF